MKNSYFTILLLIALNLIACSSSQSFNSFYQRHKADTNVSSFQVPSYLKSILRNASPEMNDLVKNVRDFKTISFRDCSALQSEEINNEINFITKNYKDMIRNNSEEGNTLIAVKEKGDIIKEVIIHKSSNNNHKILFLKGNFDPERIKQLAANNELENIGG